MKVALTTVLDGTPEGLDSFLGFHRDAGVDVVVVGESEPSAALVDALESYEPEGFVQRVRSADETELARVAADELGADWLIPTTLEELWWPRGESLKDVLEVIPARYDVVQALVRMFVCTNESSEQEDLSAFGSRTVRTSLLGPDGSDGASLEELLRPVYRAGPDVTLGTDDRTLGERRSPLRAWYPIEVLRFPSTCAVLRVAEIDAGVAEGSLVVDTRVRDQLATRGGFGVPSIVDDVAYAVECAAVGEVDLVRLDGQITDLELRIAALEARFLPTVRRALRRLARRAS